MITIIRISVIIGLALNIYTTFIYIKKEPLPKLSYSILTYSPFDFYAIGESVNHIRKTIVNAPVTNSTIELGEYNPASRKPDNSPKNGIENWMTPSQNNFDL